MEDNLIKIERKDGIIYERQPRKEGLYNKHLTIKIKEETILDLKKIAKFKGIKYQTMVRTILEEFVSNYN